MYNPGDDKFLLQDAHKEGLDMERKHNKENVVRSFTESSLKTLAFAYADIEFGDAQSADWDELVFKNNQFTFIGIVGMRDDLRPDSLLIVENLSAARIDVKMITGDTRITAVNVGK